MKFSQNARKTFCKSSDSAWSVNSLCILIVQRACKSVCAIWRTPIFQLSLCFASSSFPLSVSFYVRMAFCGAENTHNGANIQEPTKSKCLLLNQKKQLSSKFLQAINMKIIFQYYSIFYLFISTPNLWHEIMVNTM